MPVLLFVLAAGCSGPPDLANEHLRQGEIALAEGRYGEAMSAFAHAHELAPHDPRVQKAQMRVRVFLMAESPARVGDEALDDVAYEAKLLPSIDKGIEAVCLAALGNVLARRGDRKGAKEKLEEAVKVDPSSALAHAALGGFLMTAPEALFQAKEELERARELDRRAPGPIAALGRIDAARGDLAAATERFEEALRIREDPATRLALGSARLQQGKHAEAALDLARVVERDPKNADALSSYGQALLGASKADEAERALRAALLLRRDAPTSIALGFALERLKRPAEALSSFGEVLAADPSSAPALFGAGVASEDLGRIDDALGYYRRLVALAAEGGQKSLVLELQRDARGRQDALAAREKELSAKDKPDDRLRKRD